MAQDKRDEKRVDEKKPPDEKRADDKKAGPKVKWEYKVITASRKRTDMEKTLNDFGEEGWELVSHVPDPGPGIPLDITLVLKRPKQ